MSGYGCPDSRWLLYVVVTKPHARNDNPEQTNAGLRRRQGSLRARPPAAARPNIAPRVRLFKG